MFNVTTKRQASYILRLFNDSLNCVSFQQTNLYVNVFSKNLLGYLYTFRDHKIFQAKQLVEITVVHQPTFTKKFLIKYSLLSVRYSARYCIQTALNTLKNVETASFIFSSANWLEREVWDMFGIHFTHHSDLRRILTDYGFFDHPLRKDFPVIGETALLYSDAGRCIEEYQVSLQQEFRMFYQSNSLKS